MGVVAPNGVGLQAFSEAIQKGKSGSINLKIDGNYKIVTFIKQVDGTIYPEDQFPKKANKFRGFVWRDDERPKSVDDLFIDDPPLELPVIKGLEDYVPQEEFFDDSMIKRAKDADKTSSQKAKATRNIPKSKLEPKLITPLNKTKNQKPRLIQKDSDN